MKNQLNKKMIMLVIVLSFIVISSTCAFAEVKSYVTADDEYYYEYEYSQLATSYSSYQSNSSNPAANLYKEFMKTLTNTKAMRNSKDKYISYLEISTEYSIRQSKNQPFNVNDFVEEVERTEYKMPNTVKKVSLDKDNKIVMEDVNIGGPQEPGVTATFTPDTLLNDGFALGKITATVKGVTGAAKYAVKYSVSNETKTEYVTTAKVNNGQATTDLVQYKAGKTIIDILVYDATGELIHTFPAITIK